MFGLMAVELCVLYGERTVEGYSNDILNGQQNTPAVKQYLSKKSKCGDVVWPENMSTDQIYEGLGNDDVGKGVLKPNDIGTWDGTKPNNLQRLIDACVKRHHTQRLCLSKVQGMLCVLANKAKLECSETGSIDHVRIKQVKECSNNEGVAMLAMEVLVL